MTSCYFIRPLDVVSVRGNRSFGGSGEYGEAIMPPWPSLFAGALRSAMLARAPGALAAFGPGKPRPAGPLGEVLGTPEKPGSFRLEWASLGTLKDRLCEAAVPLPADLVSTDSGIHWLRPSPLPAGVRAGFPLPLLPVLRAGKDKAEAGRFLSGKMLEAYIAGGSLPAGSLQTHNLYKRETRVGIAMDNGTATAEDGMLYSTEAVSFQPDCGFVVAVSAGDANPKQFLPDGSLVRLGGDGKGAVCQSLSHFRLPQPPLEQIERHRHHSFRLVLTSPGIFREGWLPDRVQGTRLEGEGFSAALVCAAVPRAAVVSGWDLAKWEPKAAQRVAPAGSVYWFKDFKGDSRKLAEWVGSGLWGDNPDEQRRAEGFNRALLAAWAQEN